MQRLQENRMIIVQVICIIYYIVCKMIMATEAEEEWAVKVRG